MHVGMGIVRNTRHHWHPYRRRQLVHSRGNGYCKEHAPSLAPVPKKATCSFEGCNQVSVIGGVCRTHGERCHFEGCNNNIFRHKHCKRHDEYKETRKKCPVRDCNNYVYVGGLCRRHAPTKRPPRPCTVEGCDGTASAKGGLCYTHAKKNKGTEEGSTEKVDEGVTKPKKKRPKVSCRYEGCIGNGKMPGGLCSRHYEEQGQPYRCEKVLNPRLDPVVEGTAAATASTREESAPWHASEV